MFMFRAQRIPSHSVAGILKAASTVNDGPGSTTPISRRRMAIPGLLAILRARSDLYRVDRISDAGTAAA